MEFRILGPLQVLDDDGRPIRLGGAKQRATLALLLLRPNGGVSRARLTEGLWGDSPPGTSDATLTTYISRLRGMLPADEGGPRIIAQPPGYRIRIEADELDLDRFHRHVARAREERSSGDIDGAREHLADALALFSGSPLEDLAREPFARDEIGRLEELRLTVLEERIDADLAAGRHAEVTGELESLTAASPFRESLWVMLMVALYRSGRQGDALMAYERARRTLADQLGVDPGPELRGIHERILRQDPSLAPTRQVEPLERTGPAPASQRSGRRPPRAVAVIGAIAVIAAVLVSLPLAHRRGGGDAYAPGTVLIDVASGNSISSIPRGDLAVAAYPIFAEGRFWVNDWDPAAYVEIDPSSGEILERITPPPRDPSIHRDFSTVTPFAVEGTSLWVTAGDDLVRMDTALRREVDRFELDSNGYGPGLAEGVAAGAGSVWVSRDVGRGQILRLDPSTGRVEHAWNDVTPYLNLAFGDGSLWAADEHGIARIDAESNVLTSGSQIAGNCGGGVGGCVAAGGGFGWTDDGSKGAIYKIDNGGDIASTYTTDVGVGFLSYSDGLLWVSNTDTGTVQAFDAITGRVERTFSLRHPIDAMVVGSGALLAQLEPGLPIQGHIDAVKGTVARFFADPNELGDEEPALNTSVGSYQIEFATCAKLLNYPDESPPAGLRLRPEIATAMPRVSADGRTYTFTVRPGYRFSPPSNQPITAETFRYSIERALSPKLAEGPTVSSPPGPQVIDDIAGEAPFLAGAAQHISGIQVSGDALSITLTAPSPDFLERLSLPYFCPVPIGTPFAAGAIHGVRANGEGYFVSAGPYYVADAGEGYVILKRNPNYQGPRPHAFDAIAIREGIAASAAVDQVEHEGWDGITNMSDPLLAPSGELAARWGPGTDDQRSFLTPAFAVDGIWLNANEGIFADLGIRRAASDALDRSALAVALGTEPTNALLSSAFRGGHDEGIPPTGSIKEARRLMRGRSGDAVMAVTDGCDPCMRVADIVRNDLASIGIRVDIESEPDPYQMVDKGGRFDLVLASSSILYPDPASFLSELLRDAPAGWLPHQTISDVRGLDGTTGTRRAERAAALASRLVREHLVIPFGIPQTSQFIGPRIGCRVFSPVSFGLDLTASCRA